MHVSRSVVAALLICGFSFSVAFAQEAKTNAAPKLIAHWKLSGDTQDSSGNGLHGQNAGAVFEASQTGPAPTVARLGGSGQFITVPHSDALNLGRDDFTISLWIHTDKILDDDIGTLISKFDAKTRTGLQLGIQNRTGVTSSSSNDRQAEFGIDAGTEPQWTDLGRPGGEKSILPFSLLNYRGLLVAGTCEPGKDAKGNVYVFNQQTNWKTVDVPHLANSVSSLAIHEDALYAGTAKYRVAGSALAESENTNLGGQVFRLTSVGGPWVSCGRLPNTEGIGGMTVYKGKLYATSLYKPAGFFRYEGGEQWTPMATPNGKRTECLGVYNGYLWATGYDEGNIYRFDGETWTDMGRLGDNTQTYSFAIHEGRLCVGTWPSGKVFRLGDKNAWEDMGRLGEELEVMGMLVHNGKLYAGSLPLAEVYRYDGGQTWTRLKQLDTTENVKYRRVWTMAPYDGKLACGVLPSGHVHALQTGACTNSGLPLHDGWRHVTALKKGNTLQTFADGRPLSSPIEFQPDRFDISNQVPLLIGSGSGDTFHGLMSDVRIYRGALSREEIAKLSAQRTSRMPVQQIVGHAGASALFPQNTMAGYVAAWNSGATCVEIDVRRTQYGVLVNFHDATVERTSNGKGAVKDLTWDQIKDLDVGSWMDPRFSGEKPRRLESLLSTFHNEKPGSEAAKWRNFDILLDLKEDGDDFIQQVVKTIQDRGDPTHTIFGVRSVEQAKLIRQLLPEARQLGLIAVPDDIEPYAAAGVETIRLWPKWLTDETLVGRVRKAGAKLHLNGTLGLPDETQALLKHRPDSLSSDDPMQLVETLLTLTR